MTTLAMILVITTMITSKQTQDHAEELVVNNRRKVLTVSLEYHPFAHPEIPLVITDPVIVEHRRHRRVLRRTTHHGQLGLVRLYLRRHTLVRNDSSFLSMTLAHTAAAFHSSGSKLLLVKDRVCLPHALTLQILKRLLCTRMLHHFYRSVKTAARFHRRDRVAWVHVGVPTTLGLAPGLALLRALKGFRHIQCDRRRHRFIRFRLAV
mmetsp:Transcript_9110/g.15912  ORF Transcript_9110/g.15912 Transcript_9110/m.15912 type:complete len:207 (+) Transcript_9110:473-1093(+)